MSDTTITAIRQPKTNIGVVTDIMEYSSFGALSQAFVIEALANYSEGVLDASEESLSTGLLPAGVWKGVAEEILQKLVAAGYRQPKPQT